MRCLPVNIAGLCAFLSFALRVKFGGVLHAYCVSSSHCYDHKKIPVTHKLRYRDFYFILALYGASIRIIPLFLRGVGDARCGYPRDGGDAHPLGGAEALHILLASV